MSNQSEIHNSQTCDCEMCKWTDRQERELIRRAADDAVELTNAEIRANSGRLLFEDAWASLSESDRRVTEIEVAERLYYAGRRDERELLTEAQNEDYREILRVARERLR